MRRIIRSILDNDMYKFTMGYGALREYPNVSARSHFINRGRTKFPAGFADRLREQIDSMASLRLSRSERKFIIDKFYFMSGREWYADWLRDTFRFDPSQVTIAQTVGDLKVVVEGFWCTAIYWEVPLMATISELYYEMTGVKPDPNFLKRTAEKGKKFREAEARVTDFATRRRHSFDVHFRVVREMKRTAGPALVGTSNLLLAKLLNLTPIGTYAHEWVQAHAAMYGYVMADRMAMEAWSRVYGAQLGTALSDTFTTESFLLSFDTDMAKLFDGVRHDSGDPFKFVDQVIEHYKALRIDPSTKTIIFSDSLNTDRVLELVAYCREKSIRCAFGIGTDWGNDILDAFGKRVPPLNMVVKVFAFLVPRFLRWIPICKLSNDSGKESGDPRAIAAAKFDLLGEE